MDINIDELTSWRQKLEKAYNDLEKEISKLYIEGNVKKVAEKEQTQDLIDKQLDLIDLIISNLENTPKMYKELMSLDKEYKKNVGE